MVAYFHCVLNKAPICLPNAMNNGYMPYDEIVDLRDIILGNAHSNWFELIAEGKRLNIFDL